MRRIDITGNQYGRWTVIEYSPLQCKYLCKCQCGNEKYVLSTNLKSGQSKSCGCLLIDSNRNRRKKVKIENTIEIEETFTLNEQEDNRMRNIIIGAVLVVISTCLLTSCQAHGFVECAAGGTIKMEKCKDKPCEGKKPIYKR